MQDLHCFSQQHTQEMLSDLDPVFLGSIDCNPDARYRIDVSIVSSYNTNT